MPDKFIAVLWSRPNFCLASQIKARDWPQGGKWTQTIRRGVGPETHLFVPTFHEYLLHTYVFNNVHCVGNWELTDKQGSLSPALTESAVWGGGDR